MKKKNKKNKKQKQVNLFVVIDETSEFTPKQFDYLLNRLQPATARFCKLCGNENPRNDIFKHTAKDGNAYYFCCPECVTKHIRYYETNLCAECGQIAEIEPGDDQTPDAVKGLRFCSYRCADILGKKTEKKNLYKWNNRHNAQETEQSKKLYCRDCGSEKTVPNAATHCGNCGSANTYSTPDNKPPETKIRFWDAADGTDRTAAAVFDKNTGVFVRTHEPPPFDFASDAPGMTETEKSFDDLSDKAKRFVERLKTGAEKHISKTETEPAYFDFVCAECGLEHNSKSGFVIGQKDKDEPAYYCSDKCFRRQAEPETFDNINSDYCAFCGCSIYISSKYLESTIAPGLFCSPKCKFKAETDAAKYLTASETSKKVIENLIEPDGGAARSRKVKFENIEFADNPGVRLSFDPNADGRERLRKAAAEYLDNAGFLDNAPFTGEWKSEKDLSEILTDFFIRHADEFCPRYISDPNAANAPVYSAEPIRTNSAIIGHWKTACDNCGRAELLNRLKWKDYIFCSTQCREQFKQNPSVPVATPRKCDGCKINFFGAAKISPDGVFCSDECKDANAAGITLDGGGASYSKPETNCQFCGNHFYFSDFPNEKFYPFCSEKCQIANSGKLNELINK